MPAHVEAKKTYGLVFAALLVLTGATSAVSYLDLGSFNVVVALAIAVTKTLLVAWFFMHLRHSSRITRLVVGGGILWLGILITLSMSDFVTRAWISVPGH